MNIKKVNGNMNNDFDICRTQVAKDSVGAYLNFRFSTQELMQKLVSLFAKDNPLDKQSKRPLYLFLNAELNPNSSFDEIEKAYQNKIQEIEAYPESESKEELLRNVNEAYEILSDKSKREAYDKFGVDPQEISLEWSKQVHKFSMEIAMSWDRNDPPGTSVRVLHVLKDIADGSVNYVIISFILILYLTGLGWITLVAPGAFMQMFIGLLQWLGVAGSVIEHIKNLGSTLTKMTIHGTDILNKTIQKDYGREIADKIFQTKPNLVDYLDSVLVVLKDYAQKDLDNLDMELFEAKVLSSFENDRKMLVEDFLIKRNEQVVISKSEKDFTNVKENWNSKEFLRLYSKPFLHGKISRSLFYCVLSEIVFSEINDDPAIFYPILEKTTEHIQTLKNHPWVPLFVVAEGRDKYSLGAWSRYTESVEWNQYNQLKEKIEKHVNWRSYDHQKDYFKVHLKHLQATGFSIDSEFPFLTKSCGVFEPSDNQWKSRHLVLYSHGSMSGAIKLLRKYRIKSR